MISSYKKKIQYFDFLKNNFAQILWIYRTLQIDILKKYPQVKKPILIISILLKV